MAKKPYKKEFIHSVDILHERILRRLTIDENAFVQHNSFTYKSLYFTIFQEAYENGFAAPLSYDLREVPGGWNEKWIDSRPLVTGDSIWDYAKEHGWVSAKMNSSNPRYQQVQIVRTWWDEWTYAWHQLRYKTRKHQTIEKTHTKKDNVNRGGR